MSDEDAPPVAFHHPTLPLVALHAAPSLSGETNTLREPLRPIACWAVGDVRFDFDSSFVLPDLARETGALERLRRTHARGALGPSLTVFGHADPVGADAYNKTLSGRRAQAIHALLTRRVDRWEHLHDHPFSADAWGSRQERTMLRALGHDGTAATHDFQRNHGLTPDGIIGPLTRRELFSAYMDAICVDDDRKPFAVPTTEFLGGGADLGGKADFQGCGELNPSLLLSESELSTLPKPKRDHENADNRRILVFLFRPGFTVPIDRWPCPRASETDEACHRRLFSDGPARRKPGAARRLYKQTRDTFAGWRSAMGAV